MSTCLITGGSGGIARALASRLRADGWRIAGRPMLLIGA